MAGNVTMMDGVGLVDCFCVEDLFVALNLSVSPVRLFVYE